MFRELLLYLSSLYFAEKMAETRKIYMRPNFNTENTGLETVIAYLHNRAVTYVQYSLKTLQNILQSNQKLLIYGSLRKIMLLLYSILVPRRKIWPNNVHFNHKNIQEAVCPLH